MEDLTNRQRQVLAFMEDAIARLGVMPSTREIQEHFGFASQTAAVNHLRALEKKGVIHRYAGKARAMALTTTLRRDAIIDIPVYGQIAAGMAGLTEQDEAGMITVDATSTGVTRGNRVFALKVRGDSMIDAGIDDGDLAIFEMREARTGDVVAALIDDETTLKRLVNANGQLYLKAENAQFPNLTPARELVVQGVMVALIRKFRS